LSDRKITSGRTPTVGEVWLVVPFQDAEMLVFAAGRKVKSYVPPSVTTFLVTGARP
jgi:hypothetical protein